MGVFSNAFKGCDVKQESARVYGKCDGFYFDAAQLVNNAEVVITIYYKSGDPEIKPMINQVFNNMKNQNKRLKSIEVKDNSIIIHQQTQAKNKMVALTESIVKQMVQFLSLRQCATGCGSCGEENVGFYEINNGVHCLCDNCAGQIVNQLEQNRREVVETKSKLVPGLIGAVIGALIGAVLWIIIYQMGYIAGIAGAVTMICAMKGWEKLGGHLDIKGVVISFAVAIATIFIANQISWALVLTTEFNKYGIDVTFMEMYSELGDLIKEADAVGDFVGELVIAYLLSLVVGIPYVINAFKSASGSYKMKKLK